MNSVDISIHIYDENVKRIELRRLEEKDEVPVILKMEFGYHEEIIIFFSNKKVVEDFVKKMSEELERWK